MNTDPENNWTAWIVNARGDRTYETTGHPSRLDALNQAWTDNPGAREIGSGFGYIGSNNVQWQSAQSRRADLRVLAAADAIATPDKPAAQPGPGTCPDGQLHRYRPLTTEERIGYREIASERELDTARKCLGCGAWSDAASVAREARKSTQTAVRDFYVVRVNGHARATYAATTLEEAVDLTFPTDDARLEVGLVQATDAGAARLMAPPLGWSGPFTVAELEERIRQNAGQQPAACHCGQCGPVPAGAKRTPCTGARLAGPEAPRGTKLIEIWDDFNNEHAGYFRAYEVQEVNAKSGFPLFGLTQGGHSFRTVRQAVADALHAVPGAHVYRNGRRLAVLALAALLPLLAARPAHAAGGPKAPRHGKPVAGCVKQAGGKWAKQTPTGKWSTVACEPEITMRVTDRANGARDGYEVRYTSPERCTVWVAEKRADDPNVIGAAYDACVDTMAEKGGV